MKIVLTFCLLAGLSAGGYFLWKNAPVQDRPSRAAGRPTTATVDARSVLFAVNAAGDIGPADQVSVRPEVNGRISELPVDIGDKVVKGALLCRLDDQDLQIERGSRLAEMDGAKLQLQKATRGFDRNKRLFAEKLVSQEIFEDSRTDYDLATNAIDRAEKNLRMVEDRISKTKILAPFDCTVLTRPVSLGQTVSGAAGFNSGTEIMTIANLNDMIVNAHINQADVTRLTAGQAVDVQVESVPGLAMPGALDRIAPQAVIKNGIKGFSARIVIKNIDSRVRPGMTAILNIPVSSADNVLAVPLAAVFTENGERYVFVKNDEKFERRNIVIGITDYSFAEVREGLTAGEVVSLEQTVAGPAEKLPGAAPGLGAGGGKKMRNGGSGMTGGPGGGGRPGGGGGGPGGPRPRSSGS